MRQILLLLVTQFLCCSLMTAQQIEFNLLAGRVAHKDNLVQPLVCIGNSFETNYNMNFGYSIRQDFV